MSVALPSFDAFLRSARRSPAVLPNASTSFYRPSATVYEYSCSPATMRTQAQTPSPPPSSPTPYYGHFVSLSPASSDCCDRMGSLSVDSWRSSSSTASSSSSSSDGVDTAPSYQYQYQNQYQYQYEEACWTETPPLTYHEPLAWTTQQPPCDVVPIAPKPRGTSSHSHHHHNHENKKPLMRMKKKYLKERQRCEIVHRVRNGEKQAHLAKEYGVSRAAVCYLLKHELEILHRAATRHQRKL